MLIPITADAFDVDLDIAYARDDCAAGRALYQRAACYLHAEAADKLRHAIALAAAIGLRLRIFDGFRPYEAQAALYAAASDPSFVSNPVGGAIPHCRGAAVDLTLIDRATGVALDMGTGFDAFTKASWHGDLTVSVDAQRNRALLLGLMSAAGWDFYAKEWWHYQLFAPRRLPALRDGVLAVPLYRAANEPRQATAETACTSGM